MAQKVNIVLVDDLDETEATETVNFGLDGRDYVIDLSDDNATKLREALAPWVAHARPTSSRGRGRKSTGTKASAASSGGPAPAEIRAWARENGFDVPERGRVSQEVRDAYSAAH